MNTAEPTLPPNSGLLNVADIVVAPNAAFARLRIVPTWGWAFLVAALLGIAGMLLAEPASQHAFEASAPALYAQAMQNVDPARRAGLVQQQMAIGRTITSLAWVILPIILLVIPLVQAVVMLAANALTRADGTFAKFYALAMTCAVVGTGIGSLLIGIIAAVRGPAAYDTASSVQESIPGLALLAPGAGVKLLAFLSNFNVAYLWSTALLALGMIVVARMPRGAAWTTAVLILALGACFSAALAR